MTTTTVLDDYEQHLQDLVQEVEKYRDTGATLREMASTLQRIGVINSDVGSTVGKVSGDLEATLARLKELRIDEVEARNAEHFLAHGQALNQASNDMKAMVHEQQRMALESLQRSTTQQKQFEALGGELRLGLATLTTQTTLIDQRTTEIRQLITDLSDRMQARHLDIEKALLLFRNILILLMVLVIAVGVVVLIR